MMINFEMLSKLAEKAPNIINLAERVHVNDLIGTLKKVKPSTWMALGSGVTFGIAGGALIRQPEINKLNEQVKKGQSEVERLQIIIRGYHEQFIVLKAKLDTLQMMEYSEQAKAQNEDIRSIVMYQYAAKEYIEISLRQKGDDGVLDIPEKEYNYYLVFKKVIDGEKIDRDDARKIQNFVYPKYKKEIENLIEFDFDDLLKAIS